MELREGLPVRNEVKAGYKNTEVGVIPEDWEVKFLSQLGENLIGLTYSPKDVKEYGHLVLRSSNIQNNKLAFENNVFVEMELPQRVIVKENDILICVRNGSKNLIGKCALIDKKTEGSAFGAFMSVYRTDYSNYIFHQFQSNIIQKQIDEVMGATINQLTNKDLATFQIPLPPTKTEQTCIATVLSDADALINSLEKLIAKKRNIKQGAMQKLLQPNPDSYREGWEVKKLGEIGECIIGLTYTPENVKESGTLVLRSSNVQNNILKYEDNVYVDSKIPEKLITRENDILICVRNGSRNLIGKCALLNGRAIGETFGAFMSVYRSEFNGFVFLLFQSEIIKRQIDEHLGATINQITNKSLNSFEIPFPSIEEQTRIATILSDMDAEIQALETKLEKYRKIKLGMMQNLLTGKIRLV